MHMHSTVYSSNMYSISMLHTLATNCAMNCTTFGSPRNCQISITTFSICTLPLLSLPNTSSTKLGGEWWKMRFRLYVKILRSSTQRFTMHESHLDLNVSASLSTGFVLIVIELLKRLEGALMVLIQHVSCVRERQQRKAKMLKCGRWEFCTAGQRVVRWERDGTVGLWIQ